MLKSPFEIEIPIQVWLQHKRVYVAMTKTEAANPLDPLGKLYEEVHLNRTERKVDSFPTAEEALDDLREKIGTFTCGTNTVFIRTMPELVSNASGDRYTTYCRMSAHDITRPWGWE